MPLIRSVEWLDQNTERNYPLAMSAGGVDQTGAFKLPTNLLVGLRLAVNVGLIVDPGGFYLKSLSVFPAGLGLVIGYGDAEVTVASTTIARSAFSTFSQYRLNGIGDFLDVEGYVTLGQLDGLDTQPTGSFTFEKSQGLLEVDCVVPSIRGISGIRVLNGASLSRRLTGDVVFVARRNQRISVVDVPGEDPQIVWDGVSGDNLNEACVCDDTVQGEPITSIGNVTPVNGRITLFGSDCLDIVPGVGSIQLENQCSKPCCGRTELETLTQALETLSRQIITFETRMANLEARSGQFEQAVLGSRLGDGACLDCGE